MLSQAAVGKDKIVETENREKCRMNIKIKWL